MDFLKGFTNLLIGFTTKSGKVILYMALIAAAIVVTLSVFGIIPKTSPAAIVADDLVKEETGVDLEKAEESIVDKK